MIKTELTKTSVLALWLVPTDSALKPISHEESLWAKNLPEKRARQYKHSRGYARNALSCLWDIPPLEIPLKAEPGKPPELENGWGFISFSHCIDALLIGWSPKRIGVDIERIDRSFAASKISDRYFLEEEKSALRNLKGEAFNYAVLEQWLIKEAAIKWQRGQISLDLIHWMYSKKSRIAIHNKLGLTVGISRIDYKCWQIAIAYNDQMNKYPIICKSN